MSDEHNRRLFGLLKDNQTLRSKGYSLAYSQSSGIVVDRAGHVHGIWNYDADSYSWLSPGNSEPKFPNGQCEFGPALYCGRTGAGLTRGRT